MQPQDATAPPECSAMPLLAAADLQDHLLVASNDLERLQRLLGDASESLMGHFYGASTELKTLLHKVAAHPEINTPELHSAMQHMAGAITALGGAVGYVLVDALHDWLPYFLVVASSSFVYVALADLIPQLQKRLSARETAAQILWLAAGMGMVVIVSALAGHQH